jgi:diadenosine tetraphosphate (Ap4A) HIT family hydrolase
VTLSAGCPFCESAGGPLVFDGPKFRVVRADEAGFPAFYRLIWSTHAKEFTDLTSEDRTACMEAVVQVEEALRQHLQPTKVNLASLGNVVPHLHWHVIARFSWDSHFPGPVWDAPRQTAPPAEIARVESLRPPLEAEIVRRLSGGMPNRTAS